MGELEQLLTEGWVILCQVRDKKEFWGYVKRFALCDPLQLYNSKELRINEMNILLAREKRKKEHVTVKGSKLVIRTAGRYRVYIAGNPTDTFWDLEVDEDVELKREGA